ncbi:MAG: hypothetical protein CM15mV13_3080 [uncultured marine virus]|nr:MAG: hypothetical protein CM15mV13_3080 [uncultured marine virus]
MEDYEYNADTSGRHLDVYNGRFCNTPEFPSGTFAYFTTVWEDQTETKEYTVTVTSETDGNRYRIDGALHPNLTFIKGSTYKFILSDLSNQNHNLLFSDASDGFHGAGTTYTTGVTQVGTPVVLVPILKLQLVKLHHHTYIIFVNFIQVCLEPVLLL